MAASFKPQELTIVLCHGSFHTPDMYSSFIDSLQSAGFTVICPRLPLALRRDPNKPEATQPPSFNIDPAYTSSDLPTQADDGRMVHGLITRLIQQEHRNVLMIAHSSGGWVATEAVTPSLEYETRKGSGQPGGVVGIFYMCAFIPLKGEATGTFFGARFAEHPPNWLMSGPEMVGKNKDCVILELVNSLEYMYPDLPLEEAKRLEKLLTPRPTIKSMSTMEPFLRVPCGYLYTKEDRILLLDSQTKMMRRLKEKGANCVKEWTYEKGHMPLLSDTENVTKMVVEFAGVLHV